MTAMYKRQTMSNQNPKALSDAMKINQEEECKS